MDPAANVVEAHALAREIIRRTTDGPGVCIMAHADGVKTWSLSDDAIRLAELVIAQIEWRESGGFDPFADPDAPIANPQANALLHRVKVNKSSHVYCPPGAGLPDDYVLVIEANPPGNHAFECGIAPDGRVSS